MIKHNNVFLLVLLILVFFQGCTRANKKKLGINFSADSTAIVFDNVDQAGLLQLKNSHYPDSVLNELISILQTPSERDTGIKELPIPGHIEITDSNIVFNPDTLFVRGRDYLVITHLNSSFGDASKIMEGKLSNKVKPLQKLLTK